MLWNATKSMGTLKQNVRVKIAKKIIVGDFKIHQKSVIHPISITSTVIIRLSMKLNIFYSYESNIFCG